MLEKILTQTPIIVLPYGRVSSQRQEIYSLKGQDQIATNWCKQNNYVKLETIIETGSAESIENRPGILRALEMARQRVYHILFAVELSRFARKMSDAIQIIDLFRALGIKVATPYKIFDFSNYNDSFLAHINSSIDELERQRIRERSERGRRKAKESGNFIGEQLPYGYTTSRIEIPGQKRYCTKIVFHEKQKEGLLKIVELYEAGMSGKEIADELTRLGYETKNGNKEWNKSVPISLLKNSWLYGDATAFKETSYKDKGKRIYIQQSPDTWISYNVPALISKERWDAIQRIMKSRTLRSSKQTRYSEDKGWYLFRDLLTCGNCQREKELRGLKKCSTRIGHRADVYRHVDRFGNKISEARYPYYVCVGRARHEREWQCMLPQMRSTMLDEKLWQETLNILSNPTLIRDAVTYSKRETIEKKIELEEKIEKKKKELEEKTSQRGKVVKNFLTADFIDEKDYKKILKEIDDSAAKINNEISALKKVKISDPKESVSLESITKACEVIKQSFGKYDFNMKRKVVETLYEQIVVDKNWSVTLHGRIPLSPEGIEILHDKFSSNFPSTQHVMPLPSQERSY